MTSPSKYQPVHIYPYNSNIKEIQTKGNYKIIKRFHIVRHAEGTHNVNKEYKDIINLDARLTDKGKDQCSALAQKLLQESHPLLKATDLVVTSPLTRCLETALYSFPTIAANDQIPFVAQESIRETVNYACDRRRNISELEPHFQERVCFRQITHDHDQVWESYEQRLGSSEEFDSHRESAELHVVADRAREFFVWVQQRPEQEIIVCTHSAFLRAFKNWGQSGGVPQLMEQSLDQRSPAPEEESPVVQYCGDEDFETFMRSDYQNCELRSFVGAFPNSEGSN